MTKPHLPAVKSSMASHAAYDEAKQQLTVRFHNGDTFQYDVPHNIGATVMGAQSFGSSFNRHVAGKIRGKKLPA